MYSNGPPHMAKQKQDNQLEHTFSSYVRIWDVALKTCQRQWMIGRSGERGSGISMLAAQHDDDDAIVQSYESMLYTNNNGNTISYIQEFNITNPPFSSVSWGCRIYWMHLCRRVRLHSNECLQYETKLHLMVSLQSWSFEECGIPLHCHYSQSGSTC